METCALLQGFHQRAVTQLAFSANGATLTSIGCDDNHSIAVYDWASGMLKASAKGDRASMLDCKFTPGSNTSFVTTGVKTIRFWSMQGRNLSSKKGLVVGGKVKGKVQAFVSVGFVGSDAVVGTGGGELYVFRSQKLVRVVPGAHVGPINCCCETPAGGLITAGKDGNCIEWGVALVAEKTHSVGKVVSAVALGGDGATLLVGTAGSKVLELEYSGKDAQPVVHVQGHCKDELWGLAAHPTQEEYCTAGDDHMLRLWSVRDREMIAGGDIGGMARACAYSPDGSLIAVGMGGSVGRGKQKCDGVLKA
ncbi:unnamed protein product [Chrysoparadoxa australica]